MNTLVILDATWKFDWLSIALVIIFIGFPALRGLRKGFGYMLIRSFAGTLILLAAFFLAKPVAGMLAGTPINGTINSSILNFLTSKSELAAQASPGKAAVETLITYNDYEALAEMGVPIFLRSLVATYVIGVIPEAASEVTIGAYIADALTILALSVIAFLAIWLVGNIIKWIASAILNQHHKEHGVKLGSRFLGMLIGVVVGAVNLITVMYVISLFTSIPFVQTFLNNQWLLEDDSVMTIGKYLLQANFFQYITQYFL